MTMTIHADPVPLRMDEHGVIRISDSRLSLEVILDYHHQGMSAEAIAEGYQDIITLADVHAVLAYYLRHRDEVDGYLHRRDQEAAAEDEAARAPEKQTLLVVPTELVPEIRKLIAKRRGA